MLGLLFVFILGLGGLKANWEWSSCIALLKCGAPAIFLVLTFSVYGLLFLDIPLTFSTTCNKALTHLQSVDLILSLEGLAAAALLAIFAPPATFDHVQPLFRRKRIPQDHKGQREISSLNLRGENAM